MGSIWGLKQQISGEKRYLIGSDGQTKVAHRWCCIIGVCFSVALALTAAALISVGTVLIDGLGARMLGEGAVAVVRILPPRASCVPGITKAYRQQPAMPR
jgi:hypothetical protein